jgi:SagB-type dehydrogenase family enzyme
VVAPRLPRGLDMTRHLHDLDFLTSVGLLVSAVVAATTGIIADLWDLNDFWYHTIAGYVMALFGVLHVVLNRHRLTGYARFRWRSLRQPPQGVTASISRRRGTPVDAGEPTRPLAWLGRSMMSRRGLFGLGLGAVGGWLLGRGLRPPPVIEAGSDVGVVYHQWSKPGILDALGTMSDWGPGVDLYKIHPGAPRIALPAVAIEPVEASGPATATTIASRRSVRAYATDTPMTLHELSHVLHLSSGISAGLQGNARRTAPSSGALYPIELYAVVHRVEGLEPGVYHYAIRDHALERLRSGDYRAAVVDQAIAQEFLGECGAVLFLTMIMQRMRPKYQDRSYRYGLLEAGHIGENAYLAATSMGLGACGVGAFMDDAINEMLGVDGVHEAAVYMLAVGHRRDTA